MSNLIRTERGTMKFLDLFSGIGGFRLGMEQAGHECVGYVEWDKYARKSYEAIHDTEGEWTASDIRSVTDNDLGLLRGKGIDVICGGFPCQAFSVAGKRGGFDDTRGTLFFEIARIAKQIKPRLLFLENVKGLLSHDQGNTFGTILNTLDELGYDCSWQVLNSKNFGVPQNRERVFIIGYSREFSRREVFPITGQGNEYSTIGKSTETAIARTFTAGGHSAGNHSGMTILKEKVRAVLTPDRPEKRQNGRRIKEPGEPSFTLTAQDRHGVMVREATKQGYNIAYPGDSINYSVPTSQTRRGRVGNGIANTLDTGCQQGVLTNEYRIRKLTPRECFRLQGFPDWAFDKAAQVNSNSQLYKQAGNSVTVNVIYEIAKRLGGNEE
jgi:DNA (cytosine-5)-methyltransferase 1